MQGIRIPQVFTVNVGKPDTKQKGGKKGQGCQNHLNHQKWEYPEYPVHTVQNDNVGKASGDMQPEVEIGGDNSLFIQTTDLFNLRRVQEVLKHISIDSDLSSEQHEKVISLLSAFADCFALLVGEVIAIPGTEHHIHVPLGTTFPKRIPHQHQLTKAQKVYLNKSIDEPLAADIIEPIRPEDVLCESPLALAQKPHDCPSLFLPELQHKVNNEGTPHGLPSAHTLKTPGPTTLTALKENHPQKWCICQNYNALNKVTKVFPLPPG
jgi:hypothetical protein